MAMIKFLRCYGAATGLLLLVGGPVLADTISIRADEWLPYNGSTRKNPAGYMIEMAERIAASNGHTIDYRNLPWDDAVAAVRKGEFDCVVGALKSDAEGFAFPAMAWGLSQNVFWKLDDRDWTYEGLASLEGVRLAVIEAYSYSEEIDAYVEKYKDDPKRIRMVKPSGRPTQAAIMGLVSRQSDVYIEDSNVAKQVIAKVGLEGRVVAAGIANEPDELYVACTPANPRGRDFANLFSAGTRALRSSGELAKILAKYSLTDWQASK